MRKRQEHNVPLKIHDIKIFDVYLYHVLYLMKE